MDVFVIPIGPDRYELYCEAPPETASAPSDQPGFIGRLRERFSTMLRMAEERERTGMAPEPGAGFGARMQHAILCWVGERVAEQRLLWNLRGETAVPMVYPQDITADRATTAVREVLRRDYDRHRKWLVVDLILLIASGVLALVPGPNLIAYFFAFRVVGHWLSMRGADQGLRCIEWIARPSEALTILRKAVALEGAAREACVREVADRLSLQHLSAFIDRVAIRHA